MSLPDQLERATNYIKMLQAKVEKMKQKKNCLVGVSGNNNNYLPNVEVRVSGVALEVVLVTGLNCQFMFNGIIRLLHEEEGVEVVSASFSQLENTVFHTVHAKVRIPVPNEIHSYRFQIRGAFRCLRLFISFNVFLFDDKIGDGNCGAGRISARLKKFVYDSI